MQSKTLIWIGLFVGSTIGGYIPVLWGASMLSLSSVLLGGVGGIAGVWVGWKLTQFYL